MWRRPDNGEGQRQIATLDVAQLEKLVELFVVSLAGSAWSGAVGLFVLLDARPLSLPHKRSDAARLV